MGANGTFQTVNLTTSSGNITAANSVIATVGVGTNPYFVALNPSGTYAYVANESSATVSVMKPSTNTVAATISVGSDTQFEIAVNPAGTYAYVVNYGSNTVSVMNL